MTKLNKNLVSTLILASLISLSVSIEQARVDPVPLQPAKSKIYIEEPVLVDIQKGDQIKSENNNVVPEPKPVAPIAEIDQEIKPMPKGDLDKQEDTKPVDSVHLEPIPLMMEPQLPLIGKLPPFLQSILSSIRSQNPFGGSDKFETSEEETESTDDDSKKPKHGSLTILLMKSLNNQNMENGQDQPKPDGVKSSFIIFKYAPKRLGGLDDPDNPNNDMIKKPMHLLGGKHDIDMKYFQQKHQLGGGDFDVDKIRGQAIMGAEDAKINNMMNEDEDMSSPPKSMISFFNSIRDYIKNKFEQDPNTINIDTPPSFLIKSDDDQPMIMPHHSPKQKQCMMLSFMRLKASVYYRTILHLLFFTGVLLFILCLIMLTLKTYKRRRALRYYSQNMNVSTIDDGVKVNPATKSNRMFLFRLGSLRNSYVQKDISNGSMLIQAPPAYDQVIVGGGEEKEKTSSSLVSSLASDYKGRFTRLNSSEDAKSLPDYEESVKPKKEDQN